MALPEIIEGTWEEIKQHDVELTGLELRVYIKSKTTVSEQENENILQVEEPIMKKQHLKEQPKKLIGFEQFAQVPGGSEAFALEKQKEIEREDSKFR